MTGEASGTAHDDAAARAALVELRSLLTSLDELVREHGRPADRQIVARYLQDAADEEFPPAEVLAALADVWGAERQLRDGFLANPYFPDGRGGVAQEPTRRLGEIIDRVGRLTGPWYEPPWAGRVIGDAPPVPPEARTS